MVFVCFLQSLKEHDYVSTQDSRCRALWALKKRSHETHHPRFTRRTGIRFIATHGLPLLCPQKNREDVPQHKQLKDGQTHRQISETRERKTFKSSFKSHQHPPTRGGLERIFKS